ncbi:MAG: hypothetical protein H6Q77_1402 [Gemmatimonadetes bacterium]|nr:hypothetical protein [Gemmatimonadota bacterium]
MRISPVRPAYFLLGLGVVLTAAGALAIDASRGILNGEAMADRTAAALVDPRVGAFVADRLTNAVLTEKPDLVAFRPIIAATAGGLVQTAPFRAIVRQAVRTAHRSALSTTGQRVLVSLPDVGVLVQSAVQSMSPAMADKIPPRIEAFASDLAARPATGRIQEGLRILGLIARAALALLLLGPALVILGIWLAPDRRRALLRAGIGLLVAAVLLFGVIPAGRAVAVLISHEALERGAIAGLWRAYFTGLVAWSITLGGIGLLVTSAATSLLETADPIHRAEELFRILATPPKSAGLVLLWSLGLTLVGGLVVAFPSDAAAAITLLAGLGVCYVGLRELFRLVLGALPEETAAEAAREAKSGGWLNRRLVVVSLLVLVLGGTVVVLARPGKSDVSAGPMQCNGSSTLCDRHLDEVVFATTHNSMSNVDMRNWMFPQQNGSIQRQLQAGIRALLIDVHNGVPVEGIVRTDLDAEAQSALKIENAVGDSATAVAVRIRNRLTGDPSGPPARYLCHGFCEIGSAPLVPELEEVRDFLRGNPEEVLVMVIEDYAPPDSIAADFEKAGLAQYVYRGPITAPLPTLRSLIEAGTPLVVFLESGAPGVPWLYPAFDGAIMETPYTFHEPQEFSCKANRGGSNALLFQINHWIESTPAPKPSNAEIVNAYDFLLKRARQCMKQRKHLPNIIAVDFYGVGDLVGVVRELNGLTPPSTVAKATP